MDKLKSIYASAYSAAITIAVVTAVTVGAELSPAFKAWLTGFTGHHWVTKSWMSLIIFILSYGIFRITNKSATDIETRKALFVLETTAIAGFFIILGFYVYEFLKH